MMHEPEFVFFPPSLSRRDIAVCCALCVFLLYSQKFLLLLLFSLFLFSSASQSLAAFLYFFLALFFFCLSFMLCCCWTRRELFGRSGSLSSLSRVSLELRDTRCWVVGCCCCGYSGSASTQINGARQFDCILLSISEMRQENERKNKRIITKYKSKYLKTHNTTKNRKIKKTHRRNNRARPCWFRPPLILPTQPRHMAT